jgi:hypothetical protein
MVEASQAYHGLAPLLLNLAAPPTVVHALERAHGGGRINPYLLNQPAAINLLLALAPSPALSSSIDLLV